MHGAFELPADGRGRTPLPRAGREPFGVLVTLRLHSGAIALVATGSDGVAPADEARVAATGEAVTVSLLAEPGGWLDIVNEAAVPAAGAIEDIRLVGVPALDTWPAALAAPAAVAGWSRYYGTMGDDLGEKARYRRYARLAAPLTVRWNDGLQFRIAPSDQLSRVLYVSGTYEPNTLRLLRAWLAPGGTFVDVGANAGVFTLAASASVGRDGRVLAVEPSGREFTRLADHVALNGLAQVTAVRAAATAMPGQRVLRVAAAPRGGLNTLGDRFAYPEMPMAGIEVVDAQPLDALIAGAGLAHVDAMKLDVEGAESEALDGAAATLRDHRPALVIEVCAAALAAAGSSVAALDDRLRSAGYTCYDIDDATGALLASGTLSTGTDRNVVALPVERAPELLARAQAIS